MGACLLFTGLELRGEHTFWCGPNSNFTGRICTPSLRKFWYCFAERLIILDRSHSAQTCRRVELSQESSSFPDRLVALSIPLRDAFQARFKTFTRHQPKISAAPAKELPPHLPV
jgi:hypothetical protein